MLKLYFCLLTETTQINMYTNFEYWDISPGKYETHGWFEENHSVDLSCLLSDLTINSSNKKGYCILGKWYVNKSIFLY